MGDPSQDKMSNSEFYKTLYERCMQFSLNIIGIYQYLIEDKREFVLSKQLLRCGTSIGANLAESKNAISRRDFIAKIYISLKECTESKYWLELLYRANYLEKDEYQELFSECTELEKILTSITKTATSNLNNIK